MFALKRLLDCSGLFTQREGMSVDLSKPGHEWLDVEVVGGWWDSTTTYRKEYVILDQTVGAIRYEYAHKIMYLRHIECIIPIQDPYASFKNAKHRVVLQDTERLQEWVICFPTLERLESWLELVRCVLEPLQCDAVIQESVIMSNPQDLQDEETPDDKEKTLDLVPGQLNSLDQLSEGLKLEQLSIHQATVPDRTFHMPQNTSMIA